MSERETVDTKALHFMAGRVLAGNVVPSDAATLREAAIELDTLRRDRESLQRKVDEYATRLDAATKRALASSPPVEHGREERDGGCDCEKPEPASGVALVSNSCPVHNLYPDPPPDQREEPGAVYRCEHCHREMCAGGTLLLADGSRIHRSPGGPACGPVVRIETAEGA